MLLDQALDLEEGRQQVPFVPGGVDRVGEVFAVVEGLEKLRETLMLISCQLRSNIRFLLLGVSYIVPRFVRGSFASLRPRSLIPTLVVTRRGSVSLGVTGLSGCCFALHGLAASILCSDQSARWRGGSRVVFDG